MADAVDPADIAAVLDVAAVAETVDPTEDDGMERVCIEFVDPLTSAQSIHRGTAVTSLDGPGSSAWQPPETLRTPALGG